MARGKGLWGRRRRGGWRESVRGATAEVLSPLVGCHLAIKIAPSGHSSGAKHCDICSTGLEIHSLCTQETAPYAEVS